MKIKLLIILILFSIFSSAQSDSIINNIGEPASKKLFLKTDFLSLFNSVLSDSENEFTFSAELGFNENLGIEAAGTLMEYHSKNYKSYGFLITAEVRKYLCCEDFNGLYAGVITGIGSESRKNIDSAFVPYKKTTRQIGLSGGYKFSMRKHFLIEPCCNIIYEDISSNKVIVENALFNDLEDGIDVRIKLNLVYLF
jgi:hypothetical protein